MKFPRLPPNAAIMKAALHTRDAKMGISSFLTSRHHSEKVVEFAGLSEHDTVCELGAGFGVLSEDILRAGVSRLVSVEWNRLCMSHLTRFQKYHKHHHVMHGDPFFFDFSHELPKLDIDCDDDLTVFIGFHNLERNFIYLGQLMEDLISKKQAFSFPKTTIITFIEVGKAMRLGGDFRVPGNLTNLPLQNYFHVELGPRIVSSAFTDTATHHSHVVKLSPLPHPVIDVPLTDLQKMINWVGGKSFRIASKHTIETSLLRHNVMNEDNTSQFYDLASSNGLDLQIEQRHFSLYDLIKLNNICQTAGLLH